MTAFSIWVDADSCPARVRAHIMYRSNSAAIPVQFVANHVIPLDKPSPLITMIVCQQEAQAADDYIFAHCNKHDIVITRDIPFAARIVEKGNIVMNDRGTLFTKENIGERLSARNFSLNLAELGLADNKRKSSYSEKDFRKFADCFEQAVQKLLILDAYGEPKTGL